ncbi:hypothetical protein P0F65_00695 [Sphingomonas sp. I4]
MGKARAPVAAFGEAADLGEFATDPRLRGEVGGRDREPCRVAAQRGQLVAELVQAGVELALDDLAFGGIAFDDQIERIALERPAE